MVFAITSVLLFAIWRISSRRRKFLSVSFAMLVGVLLFVGLGLELDRYEAPATSVAIIVAFYLFLVVGERCATRVRLNERRLGALGDSLAKRPLIRTGSLLIFAVFAVLPVLRVLASGQSIGHLLTATWASDTQTATSQMIIEYSAQSRSGMDALLTAILDQLTGFWYLGLGIALLVKPRFAFLVLIVYICGTFVTGSPSRTIPMMAVLLPVMIWALSTRRRSLRTLVVIALIGFLLLVALDYLVQGRQGKVAEGSLSDRLERTLRTDFAYGGLGLAFGMDALPDSSERGIDYLVRIAVQPVPRALWSDKPNTNPNQLFTEWYTGLSLERYRNILLFTPLGEAMFFFGYLGIALVPFLYGFTAILLERFYSTSPVYKGLLIQVYLWAFLGMRLTYFNLFSTLVAGNFVLLSLLVTASFLRRRRGRRTPSGEAQHGLP